MRAVEEIFDSENILRATYDNKLSISLSCCVNVAIFQFLPFRHTHATMLLE